MTYAADGDRQSATAPAKVNLTLRIRGRRADGYHELESVVAKVTIYDGIDVYTDDGPVLQIQCTDPAVPTNARNSIWQAVQLLRVRAASAEPVRVVLHKRIPVGGGLGGGSSDAATVLRMLNRRWRLGLPRSELHAAAGRLGSDVAMFLWRSSVCISGRGEVVEPVQLPWNGWLLLVLPPFGVSTQAVYRRWQSAMRSGRAEARACLDTRYAEAEALNRVLFNDLNESVYLVEPRLREVHKRLEEVSERRFHVSGSGSTLFTCLDSHEEAEQLRVRVENQVDARAQLARVIDGQDNQ